MPGVRFVALDSKTTSRPSADTAGMELAPLPGAPVGAADT